MKRYRIVYKEEAIADIESIREYIDKSQSGRTEIAINKIVDAIRSLEYLPMRNRVRHSRKTPGLSVYAQPVISYLIYYRVDEAEGVVRILTIRHGARRQPRRFK